MKYKLTICIATYNRAKFLDELLNNLIQQVLDLDEVSILVVDGCSTDHTQEICNKYSKLSDSFKSILLEKKGGIDKDYDIAVRSAESEFCWLFCDDDSMEPESVKSILKKLMYEDPDLMIINSSLCDYSLDRILQKKSLDIDSDILIENEIDMQDRIYELCQTYLGFTGALLVRKEAWCEVDTKVFYGNRFGDMCTIGRFPQSSKVLIVHHPYVLIRLGNAEWTEISFKIWYEYYPSVIKDHSQLSDRVIKMLVPDTFIWNLKFLLWYRATDSYRLNQYKAYMRNKNYFLRSISLLILFVPPFILRYLFILRAILKKDRLTLYNLTKGRVSKNAWKSDINSV